MCCVDWNHSSKLIYDLRCAKLVQEKVVVYA